MRKSTKANFIRLNVVISMGRLREGGGGADVPAAATARLIVDETEGSEATRATALKRHNGVFAHAHTKAHWLPFKDKSFVRIQEGLNPIS